MLSQPSIIALRYLRRRCLVRKFRLARLTAMGQQNISDRESSPLAFRTKKQLFATQVRNQERCTSTAALDTTSEDSDFLVSDKFRAEIQRLRRVRVVGIFAHVDAGKTTVTERMLALAGVIRRAGSVDDGDTVTDYLPAERERGITIQSAAIAFPWSWHNNRVRDDLDANDSVSISLIDTPGHIDFSVEVSRSVAVLDGAVLVVDAVAGVQAQTETVWRAMTRPSSNNHETLLRATPKHQDHAHEPLPCLALINKMDKEGCSFGYAIQTLREKLPGANPVAIQIPLFRSTTKTASTTLPQNIIAMSAEDTISSNDEFAGVVDLVHMRAILWPDHDATKGDVSIVEQCVPEVVPLLMSDKHVPLDENCPVTVMALEARQELIESLAEGDVKIEAYYLRDEDPSDTDLRTSLRDAVISHRVLPVMASAALRGKGIEPVLDAIADLLPSPLDRVAPALHATSNIVPTKDAGDSTLTNVTLGHSLHPSLLALAFKVVHMKGRGGSGDGRVVFARVYSGEIQERDTVHVISPPAPGEMLKEPRLERVGGMLELAGGRFGNLQIGSAKSGEVCALIGLKSVVTGDTIVSPPLKQRSKKGRPSTDATVCLAGVSSPKPVLTVRLEAETANQQNGLSEALSLLAIEDPSLHVEESDAVTLLSGLGELHIEVTLDRLRREFGIRVDVGAPSVTYRQTITSTLETDGFVEYDKTIGSTRLQSSVHLRLEPSWGEHADDLACIALVEPIIKISSSVREFLDLDPELSEDELAQRCEMTKALVQGCLGALKRGYGITNVVCHVLDLHAEMDLAALQKTPGALRAAVAHAVTTLLMREKDACCELEPTMSIEIAVSNELVGSVLSDLTSRRGTVDEVLVDSDDKLRHAKALIRGLVPLSEILGYADKLRSITGGDGFFTAEYKGHSPRTSNA